MLRKPSYISLGLMWGHVPMGTIRCTKRVIKQPLSGPPFKLSRSHSTGKFAASRFDCLGLHHIMTSQGPRPISLLQIATSVDESLPREVASILHCLAIGYPLVGESYYRTHEKFFNPPVPPPLDDFPLMLRPWVDPSGRFLFDPKLLTDYIIDFSNEAPFPLPKLNGRFDDDAFDGECSASAYVDHPGSIHIRRDRGRPTSLH
jgi:hypothetical protein